MCNDSPSSPTGRVYTLRLLGLHCNGAMLLCSGGLKGGGLHRLDWCFRGRSGGRWLGSLLLLPVSQQCLGVLKHLVCVCVWVCVVYVCVCVCVCGVCGWVGDEDMQFNADILVSCTCGTPNDITKVCYSTPFNLPPFHLSSLLLPPPCLFLEAQC